MFLLFYYIYCSRVRKGTILYPFQRQVNLIEEKLLELDWEKPVYRPQFAPADTL